MIPINYSKTYKSIIEDTFNNQEHVYILMSDKFGFTTGSTRIVVGKVEQLLANSFKLNYIVPGDTTSSAGTGSFRYEPGRSICLLTKEEASTFGYNE